MLHTINVVFSFVKSFETLYHAHEHKHDSIHRQTFECRPVHKISKWPHPEDPFLPLPSYVRTFAPNKLPALIKFQFLS